MNTPPLNQFKKDMTSVFSEDDFSTFISQKDAKKYGDHLKNHYFKSLLTMKSIYEYKIYEGRQALKEGFYTGSSPGSFIVSERNHQEEYNFYLKNQSLVNDSSVMLRVYEVEIEKYLKATKIK